MELELGLELEFGLVRVGLVTMSWRRIRGERKEKKGKEFMSLRKLEVIDKPYLDYLLEGEREYEWRWRCVDTGDPGLDWNVMLCYIVGDTI